MIRSDRYTWLKYGSYALLMLGFFVLQSSRGTAVWLNGATVNALPFLVASVALLDGPYVGGIFGFAGGVLLSINTTGVEGFASLSLGLFGILFGLFGAQYLRNILFSALAGGLVCMAVESFFRYVFHDLLIYGMGLPQALGLFGRQLLLSLPAGALAYGLVFLVHRRFTEETT
ncbi:MAG: hypothetical protein IJA84_06165 [Clostridia bacterium]|nr:hypothetical protein [Clostridia bacterium]